MKIALLSTMYPFRGGIAQFNAALYRELEKAHQVQAYTFTRQYPGLLFPGHTQYVTAEDRADPIPTRPVLDSINPYSYWRTAGEIGVFGPHLLLTKFWMPFFAPSLGYVAGKLRRRGVRAISILDNVLPHERRPGDRLLAKYFLSRNDAFVVMSEAVERDLLALAPRARYVRVPHPAYCHFGAAPPRAEARRRLAIPENKNVLLFFGFIREYKGLNIAIQAMQFLSDAYLLVIAGEMYGDWQRYQALIEHCGVKHRIAPYIRYINDDEVPLFFGAADVAVLPYKSATQSGIGKLARHYALPQIVTRVGGLPEEVDHGKTGLVVRPNDPEALAAAIRSYFEHDMRPGFVAALHQRREFGWPEFVDRILALYDQIEAKGDG